MGWPEIVVNSAWRSGLFASTGAKVFSSQAFSSAEGVRCAGDFSLAGIVVMLCLFGLLI